MIDIVYWGGIALMLTIIYIVYSLIHDKHR